MSTLLETLNYAPQPLRFGTSGRRGEVIHLTQLEVYTNAFAELEYLQSLPREEGGIRKGEEFFFAYDLRRSSTRLVPEQGGRGEIAQTVERAIRDAGMKPVNLGSIPTPALTFFALQQGKGSIMITGSHIPFDRNGYKANSAKGELLKKDETPINEHVERIRHGLYHQPASDSVFGPTGDFKAAVSALSSVRSAAAEAYVHRYTDFFHGRSLKGMRLLAYQHSAVGRDLLVTILEALGAEVIPVGRSDTFVPIDTENVGDELLEAIQRLTDEQARQHGPIDAVVSTDGDSDRPLVLGVDANGRVRFFGGDLLGMVVAEFLRADAVVVPISCNDAVDCGRLQSIVEPKTRIGSPHVIAGMERALLKGRHRVCGWEANGGFLTGSDFERRGRTLKALPTRDAVLPILSALHAAREQGVSLVDLFARLPRRFSKAALLTDFPRTTSLRIVGRFSPKNPQVKETLFDGGQIHPTDEVGKRIVIDVQTHEELASLRKKLEGYFGSGSGFGVIQRLNYVDGVRITFDNGDVAHIRPSGNADELRIYAVADTQQRADAIAQMGVAEPEGLLRRLERAVT